MYRTFIAPTQRTQQLDMGCHLWAGPIFSWDTSSIRQSEPEASLLLHQSWSPQTQI